MRSNECGSSVNLFKVCYWPDSVIQPHIRGVVLLQPGCLLLILKETVTEIEYKSYLTYRVRPKVDI